MACALPGGRRRCHPPRWSSSTFSTAGSAPWPSRAAGTRGAAPWCSGARATRRWGGARDGGASRPRRRSGRLNAAPRLAACSLAQCRPFLNLILLLLLLLPSSLALPPPSLLLVFLRILRRAPGAPGSPAPSRFRRGLPLQLFYNDIVIGNLSAPLGDGDGTARRAGIAAAPGDRPSGDVPRAVGVKLNPISGIRTLLGCPVVHASSRGRVRTALSFCLARAAARRPGFGLHVPGHSPATGSPSGDGANGGVGRGPSSDGGLWAVDTDSGECRLLVPLAKLVRAAGGPPVGSRLSSFAVVDASFSPDEVPTTRKVAPWPHVVMNELPSAEGKRRAPFAAALCTRPPSLRRARPLTILKFAPARCSQNLSDPPPL